MKKIMVLISLIFLMSCTLESEFSLVNNERIKKELLGVWKAEGKPVLTFKKHNKKEYEITFTEDNKSIHGFTSTIKGIHFLDIYADGTHAFYQYKVKGNKLFIYAINKPYRDEKFSSQKELLQFLRQNIKKKDFFMFGKDNVMVFEK